MSSILIAVCIATTLVSQICFAAEMVSKQSSQAALELSGGNRSELEAALLTVKSKDTEYLISHASQYDLVNLTSAMIIENMTYAHKVHVPLPYLVGKLDDEMWREWVLPSRVLEEDVELWRKDLYDRLQPVVRGKKTVREVVEAVHAWLMIDDGSGKAGILYGISENRSKTPSQMFEIGEGSCGELSMMFVYALRAVGIPARHCLISRRFDGPDVHYYGEYWDSQQGRWIPVDPSDNKPLPAPRTAEEATRTKNLESLVYYAHPGFPERSDSYHSAGLDRCLDVTSNMFQTRDVEFRVPAGFAGAARVYVWNSDAWWPVGQGAIADSTGGQMQLADAKSSSIRPALFTAVDGKQLLWGFGRPGANAEPVDLNKAVAGECLRWTLNGVPKP
jgi:transglutaminase-like putative cysteine protease